MNKVLYRLLLIFFLMVLFFLVRNKIRLETLSTDKMMECLNNSYFSSQNSCGLSENAMYFELLSRKGNDRNIGILLSEMYIASSKQGNPPSLLAEGLLLLEEDSRGAINLFKSHLEEKITSNEDISRDRYLQYELFALGMIGEDASCAVDTVMSIAEMGSDYENDGSFRQQENLAFWTVEQLLGETRTFKLPSDDLESDYGDWFSCTTPVIGDRDYCDKYNDIQSKSKTGLFWVALAARKIENQYSIKYYAVHLPEDNGIIYDWWIREGQFVDWGTCDY